jgi:hypothetical protein
VPGEICIRLWTINLAYRKKNVQYSMQSIFNAQVDQVHHNANIDRLSIDTLSNDTLNISSRRVNLPELQTSPHLHLRLLVQVLSMCSLKMDRTVQLVRQLVRRR